MEARVDQEKYSVGAHIEQNFIALKQGPAMFRPGTVYVQPVKNSANRTWIRRFEFSQTQAFVLEFGDKYVRFYTLHGPLLATGVAAYNGGTAYVLGNLVLSAGIIYYCIAPTTGNAPPNATYWYPLTPYNGSATTAIYEIPSPYAAADLTDALGEFALQITQSGDVLYIAGGYANVQTATGYAPMTLTRFANNPPNWQFASYAPVDGPFSPAVPLVKNQKTALYVSNAQGTGITITAVGQSGPFASTDVGRLVRIGSQTFNNTPWATATAFTAGTIVSNNGNNYVAQNSATSGGSPPVHISGSALDGPAGVRWLYSDSGYGIAQITAFTDANHVTANVLLPFPANVVGSSATITAATKANPCVLTAANSFTGGTALFIVGVVGMTQLNNEVFTNGTASGTTVTLVGTDSTTFSTYTSGGTVYQNASTEWQLGAWSNTTEWPRCSAFFKDRLTWGGKLNIWASVPGSYSSHAQDFNGQVTTDAAMNLLVSGGDASSICWLSPAVILLIGTEGGEYGMDAANFSTAPMGPANVEILRQSNWRCRHVEPSLIGTTILYTQRAGRKVLAADYNFYLNRYDSTDQSKYSYHITISGITGTAMQQEPWSILWAHRTDGTLLSYTFNREDAVTAWTRHNMGNGGLVESLCCIPAPDGARDEIWMIVNRTINGVIVRTVEYMAKHYEGPQAGNAGDAQASAWYVDCGVLFTQPGTTGITNVTSGGSQFVPYSTTYTYPNTFTPGQLVTVTGVNYTGPFNPNVTAVAILKCTSTTFTISGGSRSLTYISGGSVQVAGGNSGTTTITGLPPVLWNQTVAMLADGGVQPRQVVSGTGTVTLQGSFSNVIIGFPYQGNLVPMRPEGGADAGTAQGKRKKGSLTVLRVVDTGGGQYGMITVQQNPQGQTTATAPTLDYIFLNQTTTGLDVPPPLFSGDVRLSTNQQPLEDTDQSDFYILVQQNDPLPMTVCGLFPNYKVEEFQ
jgi:hypothetical protein